MALLDSAHVIRLSSHVQRGRQGSRARNNLSERPPGRDSISHCVGRSVRRSVGPSVDPSVPLYFFFAKWLIELRVRDLWRSAMFFGVFIQPVFPPLTNRESGFSIIITSRCVKHIFFLLELQK